MDHYAVIGNPISHSRSPQIHTAFAAQTRQAMRYTALFAPLDGFTAVVRAFHAGGGCGLNVTLPFKLEAYHLADKKTERAEAAGAVNTLLFSQNGILGDNTDGAGLVRDLGYILGAPLQGYRILLLGAGGAARGALLPLIEEKPAALTLTNRTPEKAHILLSTPVFAEAAQNNNVHLSACRFDELAGQQFDIIINATAASLANEAPPLPEGIYAHGALAYDMMYGTHDTAFLSAARNLGAGLLADGFGMLIEQAAESFLLWRGIQPDTHAIRAMLRPPIAH